MQAIAFTKPKRLIKPALQRRQLSSILGGVGTLLSGGNLTHTIDQSNGTNPSTSDSQPAPPQAKAMAPTEQPMSTNLNNTSKDATPFTSAYPPVSPVGSTNASIPASPTGSTITNLPVLPVVSTTTETPLLNNTTDLPPSLVSNKLASNFTDFTSAPPVPAPNTASIINSTPSPASTTNSTAPHSANVTFTPPDLNITTASNETVTPIAQSTTDPRSPDSITATTNTVSVADSSHTPVSTTLPSPFVSHSSQPHSQDSSSGLSNGAITGIAILAGVVGFIILFWIGVQMLQSKHQKHEEASMQEIDFDPSGGSSVNGDTFPGHDHNQQTPTSASFGKYGHNFSTQDHRNTQYEDDAHMCANYVSSTEPSTPNMAGVSSGAPNYPPTSRGISFHLNQSMNHTQGYHGHNLACQTSYSHPSAHGQYTPRYPCFAEGPPMPDYPYESHRKPGPALSYHGSFYTDLRSPGYQETSGMSYGNMVAQSGSLTHPPAAAEFCYPPPNNSPHMVM